MIQANELRIGNLVNFTYKHSKEYLSRACQVISIADNHIVVSDKGVSLVSDFQPIPLTPEILEKAGFENEHNGWYAPEVNGQRILIYRDKEGFKFNTNSWRSMKINSLHQLQNLIFALTGKELEITP